jgi:hypothetical protein
VGAAMINDVKDGKEVPIVPSVRRRINPNGGGNEVDVEAERFFLSKAGGNAGHLDLGRELASEAEAIVESLKAGLSYFSVVEWRGIADFSGKKPQLKKEAVPRAQKSS